MPSLGWPELLIILVVALLLFGGSRLAGVGKGTGRAIREFKEETKGLKDADKAAKAKADADAAAAAGPVSGTAPSTAASAPVVTGNDTVESEIVDDKRQQL